MTPWLQFGTESTAGVVFGPWNLENNENPWHYDSYRIRHSGCMLTRFMIFRSICSRINFVFNLKQTLQNVSSIILKLGLVPMTSTWKNIFVLFHCVIAGTKLERFQNMFCCLTDQARKINNWNCDHLSEATFDVTLLLLQKKIVRHQIPSQVTCPHSWSEKNDNLYPLLHFCSWNEQYFNSLSAKTVHTPTH